VEGAEQSITHHAPNNLKCGALVPFPSFASPVLTHPLRHSSSPSCPQKHMSGNPGKFAQTKTDRQDRSGRGKDAGAGRKGGQGGKNFRDDPSTDGAPMDKGDPCYDPEAVETCRNYSRGRCRLGDRCSRRHEGDVEQQMPKKLDEVCNNYLAGKCQFGEFCRRKHEGTPVAAAE
jgi:hypothetical protein